MSRTSIRLQGGRRRAPLDDVAEERVRGSSVDVRLTKPSDYTPGSESRFHSLSLPSLFVHALDCSIPREARQVMGRWSGETSQDTYIMWDIPQRVAFTAHM